MHSVLQINKSAVTYFHLWACLGLLICKDFWQFCKYVYKKYNMVTTPLNVTRPNYHLDLEQASNWCPIGQSGWAHLIQISVFVY